MHIPNCWRRWGEWWGEIESEGVGGDTKIKFTSFQLSAPCSQMTIREPEALYKLELPSHYRMPEKRVETISASLWEHLPTPSKSRLKVPLGAGTTHKWYLPFKPSGRDPRSVKIRESNVRFYLLVLENITGQAVTSFGKLKYRGRLWLVFPPNSSTPQWEQMGSTRIKPNNKTEQMRAIQ